MKKNKISVRELAILSMLGAMMIVGQIVMAPLPNIEPVSLLILCCAAVYGWKTLFPIYVFVLVEGLVFGVGMWFISYLYIWVVPLIAAILIRDYDSALLAALVSAAFGLIFGALTSIPYLFIGGIRMMLSYIASGLIFDVLHCAGNFVLALVLYKPLVTLIKRLNSSRTA